MSSNKMLIINMFASALTYIVSFFVGMFLSPYIVKNVGIDAYGFVSLADSFVSYASLSAVALNALAGSLITINYYKKDIDAANRYYSSVFYANSFISLFVIIVELIIWLNLDSIINIPSEIYTDVRILFATLFVNCIVNISGSVFSVATFATNKLYISSKRTIESQLLRALFLIILFYFLSPKVWYLGAATLFTGIYCLVFNVRYMKLLLPEMVIKKSYFDIKSVWFLLKSGVWSLVNQVGAILLDGLDLLITNIFIDAISMGILSLAKIIPSIIRSIIGSIASVFSPNLTILFAIGKKEEMLKHLRQSMKIMGVLTNLPIIILAVCGEDFFRLWQPTQDSRQLQILSLLTIAGFIVNGSVNSIYSIFTITNKLKVNSIAMIASGGVSVFITFILVKFTSLGIYAVAGTSTIITVLRNVFISIPYAAKCLDLKWNMFYPEVVRSTVYFVISVFMGGMICKNITANNWIALFGKGTICGLITILIGAFVILNKDDRFLFLSKIRRKKG